MVLDSATKDESSPLDSMIEDSVTTHLHSLICTPIDYSRKEQITNQNELLRCFAMLSTLDFVFVFMKWMSLELCSY